MKEGPSVFGLIFLLFLLAVALLLVYEGDFTGAFIVVGDDFLLSNEHLSADCSSGGQLGRDFALHVIIPDYGCDVRLGDLLCQQAAHDGVLPGDVHVEFDCSQEQQQAFIAACTFEILGTCSPS